MKTIAICALCVLSFCLSIKQGPEQPKTLVIETLSLEKAEYRITRITEKESCFIIYAKRGKNKYKIVSPKPDTTINGPRIRRGKTYSLILESAFPRSIDGLRTMGPGSTGFTSICIGNTPVSIEPQNGIWDLFYATNLIGLVLKLNNQ